MLSIGITAGPVMNLETRNSDVGYWLILREICALKVQIFQIFKMLTR